MVVKSPNVFEKKRLGSNQKIRLWALVEHTVHSLSKMQKRQFREEEEDNGDECEITKRTRREPAGGSTALVAIGSSSFTALTLSSKTVTEPGRTSSLMAPEVVLLGHAGAVYSIAFDPLGEHLCSGSFDKQICTFFRKFADAWMLISKFIFC